MNRLLLFLLLTGLGVSPAAGQSEPWHSQENQLVPVSSVASNRVRVLDASGDSLWSGPLLTVYLEEQNRFATVDRPILTEQDNVVASIEARGAISGGGIVWAGLAFDAGDGVPGAGGFLVSTDGGDSFSVRPAQLDRPSDTTVTYGETTLPAVPVTDAAQSAPQDLALGPEADTVWVAGGRSGLRRSVDQGKTWTRAVLPPDTAQTIHPDTSYKFLVGPPLESGRGSRNHIGYSVLVDETGTVWAGTAGGLNRSTPADVEPDGDRGWRRFTANGTPNSLTGNSVVALTEQPRSGARNPLWMATWPQSQRRRFGVTVTRDGGRTFQQALIGERIYDLAARQDRLYAAGDRGLFVSGDQGKTWRTVEDVELQDEGHVLPSGLTARAVATTTAALWVGTTEGLLRLERDLEPQLLRDDPGTPGPRWRLFRARVPVNPDSATAAVPDVETYAYPNPFTPSQDGLVRIVYELPEASSVEISIYDFSMNRVRTIREQKPAGQRETVWRGRDQDGLRVPTGAYIYTVEAGGTSARGKILVTN